MKNKRILTIQDWKNRSLIKEEVVDNMPAIIDDESIKLNKQIDDIVKIAKDMELPKNQTIDYVKTIYTDAVKAPEEISVTFVRDNLDKIVSEINKIPESEWPKQQDFLSISEMFKKHEPKTWVLFKIDESIINDFVSKNKYNYVYNKLGYIYISDVANLTETFTNSLNESKAIIKYKNVKWIKNIIK